MIIKSGDYVESLHGNVGVVKTVGKTVPVDGKEQFSFDWEITRPSEAATVASLLEANPICGGTTVKLACITTRSRKRE